MYINNIVSLFSETIEYRDFQLHGILTPIILALFVAIISAIIQAWGIIHQAKRIRRNRSIKSLPLTFFAFQFLYFMAYFIYGFKIQSSALIVSNSVGLLFLPIIITIVKYKLIEGSSFKREILISPFLLMIIPCVIFIETQWSLIAVLVIALIVFAQLVLEIIHNREIRNIEPKFIISIVLCSLVWLWYGIEASDFGLITSSSTTIAVGIIFGAFHIFAARTFKKNPATIN